MGSCFCGYQWLDEGTPNSYAKAIKNYQMCGEVLRKYGHILSFKNIQSECAETIARLKEIVLERINSLSTGDNRLSNSPFNSNAPDAGDSVDSQESTSPVHVVDDAALLLQLGVPADLLREVVLSFSRNFFVQRLARSDIACEGGETASGGVHDNIADKIKNLNDALVPSFVFFLQQYQLRFVTTAPSCRSGASLSGSLPSPPLPSDSASLGASTSGESQLQGKVGKEQTLAAVGVLALVRELGRTYLATAKHLLDSDGGLCEEEETHEDKQQESTQRRITTIVAALKQVTNAASMIHRSLQPTRFHCGLSNSAPLTTVMNEEGILEIAAEVVE
jgi:hypothetical protein